ncbi:MAG: ABC transporter ATP-binding protein [Planctomycetes bacterium]|nr:ABC transporter ATP-binding protein [Planctomycetota bacterium]
MVNRDPSESVVEVTDLSRQFGSTMALDGISLRVQLGLVYGLVGANGAGKTTLIKHLLGSLRAKQGSVRVFGMDPVRNPVEVLRRIGYLSEDRDLPEWMRIDELMRLTAACHPNWDSDYGRELLATFGLDVSKQIQHLSKGMRAQTGLIAAVAHRPDLLLLDEPSTGLDAVVRRDILNEIIRAVADDGRTAIFSSHLLDEVELMSDYVFMMDEGKMVLEGSLDDIKAQHQQLSVRSSSDAPPPIEGILSAQRQGDTWSLVCNGASQSIHAALQEQGIEVIKSRYASLQEIFVARVGHDRHASRSETPVAEEA